MAFHMACPITCLKICYCTLGTRVPLQTQHGRVRFLQNAVMLEHLLSNPHLMLASGTGMVDILVPRLPREEPKKAQEHHPAGVNGVGNGWEDVGPKRMGRRPIIPDLSVANGGRNAGQVKNAAAIQQDAESDMLTTELAAWDGVGMVSKNDSGEPLGADELTEGLMPQVTCGLCGIRETIGSAKAGRMLSCQACKKQYHRKCIKQWADYRDLFNWASWVCGSCRSCEVCKRTVEPNKLMFCKRCDEAYHVYCQQPPLKHVPKGPFMCPKHARCHSCGTHVPGGGVSSRWFLSYTMCDACGRLFVKGKYCPICLKVYRDSEPSPMVCCDLCEHWVHCACDSISDEKYQQYQVDDNLHYTCAACRGECHKVTDLDSGVEEMWRRRDSADAEQKAELRTAAGLPSEDEMKMLYPSSDDEIQVREVINHMKGSSKQVMKKTKKLSTSGIEHDGGLKNTKIHKDSIRKKKIYGKVSERTSSKLHSQKRKGSLMKKSTEENVVGNDGSHMKTIILDTEETKTDSQKATKQLRSKSDPEVPRKTMKKKENRALKTKGVLGKLKHKDTAAGDLVSAQDPVTTELMQKTKRLKFAGSEETGVHVESETPTNSAGKEKKQREFAKRAGTNQSLKDGHSESVRRRRVPSSKYRDMETTPWHNSRNSREVQSTVIEEPGTQTIKPTAAQAPQGEKEQSIASLRVPTEVRKERQRKTKEIVDDMDIDDTLDAPRKRLKVADLGDKQGEGGRPLRSATTGSSLKGPLHFKIKRQSIHDTLLPKSGLDSKKIHNHDDLPISVRGQRLKRKRSLVAQKGGDEKLTGRTITRDSSADDSWILQRLGTDAITKRVEVFWPIDNIWYQGTVVDVFPQKLQFAVHYDDGEEETLEFGKELVRLLSSSKKVN
ncbi:unnamed protein product [Sphagnum troendelagicum]|uniref:PHD-type domain-containing protein n=1 Tax=Sphagnum troendelagicum TaxID=128251 RepID=A0ABP0TY93_9BRYO